MDKYAEKLKKFEGKGLFSGIKGEEFVSLLHCLSVETKEYDRGENLIVQGQQVLSAGLVVEGMVCAVKTDYEGRESVWALVGEGGLFGEILMSAGGFKSPVSVVATTSCDICYISLRKIVSGCNTNCASHEQLRLNFLEIIAKKFWEQNRRLTYLSIKSLRMKLLAYFSDRVSDSSGSLSFAVPFNREQMAAYLGAERSALCRELSRMKREGLIFYQKNQFSVLEPELFRRI